MAAERSELAASQQGEVGSFTWRVTALSEQTKEELYSDTFTVGGVSWCLKLYPKGYGDGAGSHLGLFLNLGDTDRPYGWSCPVSWKLVLKSQTDEKHNVVRKDSADFNRLSPSWTKDFKVRSQLPSRFKVNLLRLLGEMHCTPVYWREVPVCICSRPSVADVKGVDVACWQFLALTELDDPVKGYLVDDTLVIEAQVILWNDMESMDSEAVTFNVRGEPFTVLKSSLQVRY
jgi:hypothetical protein